MVSKLLYPQEIELWHVLPSLRRELALQLLDLGYTQHHIAKTLGISEPAVSQYMSHKRASGIKFSSDLNREISSSAKVLSVSPHLAFREIMRLLSLPAMRKLVCSYHQKEGGASSNCEACKHRL